MLMGIAIHLRPKLENAIAELWNYFHRQAPVIQAGHCRDLGVSKGVPPMQHPRGARCNDHNDVCPMMFCPCPVMYIRIADVYHSRQQHASAIAAIAALVKIHVL